MIVRLKPGPSKIGVCRVCGCTDAKPCQLLPYSTSPAKQPVLTCSWTDQTKTLCTNPDCLEAAKARSFQKRARA